MLPRTPPRVGQVGFLYVPPYRVQGVSVAGEQTMVQVPELDVAFDVGMCPRVALTSPYIALSHGHMDHVGGLPYYFSQRMFQGMGAGTCICHAMLADPLRRMMQSWIDLEQQETPHEIVGLEPGEQVRIKNDIYLRGIEVSHSAPSMGYVVIEQRNKLKQEYLDLPQEHLRELKSKGVAITRTLEIPLVAYTGDTELGPYLYRDEFASAKIVVSECTFFEDEHRRRAAVGRHLHVDDIATLLEVWQAEAVILIHLTRRTNIAAAREQLVRRVGEETARRVLFLMDHRANRDRYEQQQLRAAEGKPISAA